MELDVMDAGELGVLSLSQKGALEKINYKALEAHQSRRHGPGRPP